MSDSELDDLRESLMLERDESHRRWRRVVELEAENAKLREEVAAMRGLLETAVECDEANGRFDSKPPRASVPYYDYDPSLRSITVHVAWVMEARRLTEGGE